MTSVIQSIRSIRVLANAQPDEAAPWLRRRSDQERGERDAGRRTECRGKNRRRPRKDLASCGKQDQHAVRHVRDHHLRGRRHREGPKGGDLRLWRFGGLAAISGAAHLVTRVVAGLTARHLLFVVGCRSRDAGGQHRGQQPDEHDRRRDRTHPRVHVYILLLRAERGVSRAERGVSGVFYKNSIKRSQKVQKTPDTL